MWGVGGFREDLGFYPIAISLKPFLGLLCGGVRRSDKDGSWQQAGLTQVDSILNEL